MSTKIIAEFENIDAAETAARLIRYRIHDVQNVRINAREEAHDAIADGAELAFPFTDSPSIAAMPLMTSYGSTGDLSNAISPYKTVDPREYEPALRQDARLSVEVDDDAATTVSNLIHSQGGLKVKKIVIS